MIKEEIGYLIGDKVLLANSTMIGDSQRFNDDTIKKVYIIINNNSIELSNECMYNDILLSAK